MADDNYMELFVDDQIDLLLVSRPELCYQCILLAIASAIFTPSTAALTIPPA
jgi:hypothetical protein